MNTLPRPCEVLPSAWRHYRNIAEDLDTLVITGWLPDSESAHQRLAHHVFASVQ
jgi:hypothetical protein